MTTEWLFEMSHFKLVYAPNKCTAPFKNLSIQTSKQTVKHKLIVKEWSTIARKCIQSNSWLLDTKGILTFLDRQRSQMNF